MDRIPTLAQTTASSSYLWPPTNSVKSSDESIKHHYFSEGEDGIFYSRERFRNRKGKGKAHEDRERPAYGIYRSPDLAPRSNMTVNGTMTTNGNRNAIIPGATPNQRVIPMRKTAFEDINIQTATGYMTPPDLKDQQRTGLDPSQYVDPYTLTAEFVSGYPDGYVAGYQAALNPGEVNHPDIYRLGGVQSSVLEEFPSGLHNPSSRKLQRLPRWMTEGNYAGYPVSPQPMPPMSAPPRPGSGQDTAEHTRRQRLPSPSSAPVASSSMTAGPRPDVVEGPRIVRSRESHPVSQQGALAMSSSAVPTQRPDVMPENVRPRYHRRRTLHTDGNMTEPEVRASVGVSQLRRRTAMSVHRVEATPANGTAAVVDHRASLGVTSARNSISSWGTVDSENPPISVSDLPVHTDFSRGARGSLHSLSSLIPHDPPLNDNNGRVNGEGAVNRTGDNATPRMRVASFSEPPSAVRTASITSHVTERPPDRRVASYPLTLPLAPFSTNNSRYTTAGPPARGQTIETTLSHSPDYIPFARFPVSAPVDASSNNDHNPVESSVWTDASHLADDPPSLAGNALGLHLSRSPDNALGLRLNRSPQISAPTPRVPSQAFLRSFSHEDYY